MRAVVLDARAKIARYMFNKTEVRPEVRPKDNITNDKTIDITIKEKIE